MRRGQELTRAGGSGFPDGGDVDRGQGSGSSSSSGEVALGDGQASHRGCDFSQAVTLHLAWGQGHMVPPKQLLIVSFGGGII